jgi:biopolymer transport protein TolR
MAFSSPDGSGQGNDDLAEINIIPLVDVMLVLLIIFMVAAPLSLSGLQVDLPHSKAKGVAATETNVILTVSKEGGYYFDKNRVSGADLTIKLKAMFENKPDKQLFIRADRSVDYGVVIDAMSAARLAGIKKMAMLTQPPKTSVNQPEGPKKG